MSLSRFLRLDKFVNLMTGYGTFRDHAEQFELYPSRQLSREELDQLYAENEIAWKIVDTLPDEALRGWILYSNLDDKTRLTVEQINRETGIQAAINEGGRLANLHGGAAVYMPIYDGQRDDQPVNFNRIRGVGRAEVIQAAYLQPHNLNRRFNHEHYLMSDERYGLIHKSRLLILQGARVAPETRLKNNGWMGSQLNRCLPALLGYYLAHNQVPNVLKSFIQDVIRLEGLKDLAYKASDVDRAKFFDRLDAGKLGMSMLNMLVLDKDDEYQRQTANVSGLGDLIDRAERRLVASSGLPHTILLGEKPGSGLGDKGASQNTNLNKATRNYQSDRLNEPVTQYNGVIGAMVKQKLDHVFPALDEPTVKEQGEVFKICMEGAAIAIDKQIISPREASTMISGGKIKPLPDLDLEAREKLEDETDLFFNDPEDPADDLPDRG